mgnify:CR=1 FL=1
MAIYIKLFEVLFPVFLVIGIGYWYGKKDSKFNTKFITTLAGNIGLPCIIFYSLTTSNIDLSVFLRFFYYIFLYVGLFAILGILVLKIFPTFLLVLTSFLISLKFKGLEIVAEKSV